MIEFTPYPDPPEPQFMVRYQIDLELMPCGSVRGRLFRNGVWAACYSVPMVKAGSKAEARRQVCQWLTEWAVVEMARDKQAGQVTIRTELPTAEAPPCTA